MKILLVEDDENKRAQVALFLIEHAKHAAIEEARSYNAAIRALQVFKPDKVILDMSLPIFDVTAEEDGFQVDAFGGIEVLRFANRRDIGCEFVVLTQFESLGEGDQMISNKQLGERLAVEFPKLYRGLVYYSPAESSWRDALKSFIQ